MAPTPKKEAVEGPRERLWLRGAGVLSDADLLAVLLGTGASGNPVHLLTHRLLREVGGLEGLAHARASELAGLLGIGPGKAARLLAAVELGRRMQSTPLRCGQVLRHSRQVFEAFAPGLRHARSEQFWAIALDARHRVRALIPVAKGGLTACPVVAADVFRPLLREGAAAAILLHNHPSGEPDPSPEDEALTARLVQVGAQLGLRILDHVIIGDGAYYSFLDSGPCAARPEGLLDTPKHP